MNTTEYRAERDRLLDQIDELQGQELTPSIAQRIVETQAEINSLAERAAHDFNQGVQRGEFRTEGGSVGTHTVDGGQPYGGGLRNLDGLRLSFDAGMARSLTESILGGERNGPPPFNLAANAAAVVDQGFSPNPIPLGKPANSLLAVLPVTQWPTSQFAYLRQTTRTSAAAIVPEGTVKQESTYVVERVPDELDVIAHLSSGVPRYWFADNPTLQQFLANEMLYGLRTAVEAMAMSDIAGATTQDNEYSVSNLVTLRTSITKLEVLGYDASAIVLHPEDWQDIELLLSDIEAIENLSLPFDAASRRLWSVPLVISVAQSVGTAHTLSQGSVGLNTDTLGVSVTWSETSNSDDWSKNLVRARCEGRYATSVFAPLGIVESVMGGGS